MNFAGSERSHSLQAVAPVELANAQLRQQINRIQERTVGLDRVLRTTREERSELSLAYREVEDQLIMQTRALIEQTRDELETLAQIAASTHASRFLKIKPFLVATHARFHLYPRPKLKHRDSVINPSSYCIIMLSMHKYTT